MDKFNNYLDEIKIEETCLKFLKTELKKEYSFDLVRDLFSLPCTEHETRHKLVLILILLEEGEVNDTIISWLIQILLNITGDLWKEYKKRLKCYVEKQSYQLSRSQLMLLANTLEVMYAKGYKSFKLLNLIYNRIPLSDAEFNPDSDDNVRIKLAKIAYSTTKYNINEKFRAVKALKHHLEKSDRGYLFGILNYYKGLCLRAAKCKNDYKDATYYIQMARNMGFELAGIYLDYKPINFETSRES